MTKLPFELPLRGEAGTEARKWFHENAENILRHINHEEYELDGKYYTCHFESESKRYGVPEAGWVVYLHADSRGTKCPSCGEDNVWEQHTIYISPSPPEESWNSTESRILQELRTQTVDDGTFAIECGSCGAHWHSLEDFWAYTENASKPKAASNHDGDHER